MRTLFVPDEARLISPRLRRGSSDTYHPLPGAARRGEGFCCGCLVTGSCGISFCPSGALRIAGLRGRVNAFTMEAPAGNASPQQHQTLPPKIAAPCCCRMAIMTGWARGDQLKRRKRRSLHNSLRRRWRSNRFLSRSFVISWARCGLDGQAASSGMVVAVAARSSVRPGRGPSSADAVRSPCSG